MIYYVLQGVVSTQYCMGTLDHAALQFLLTSIIIILGWLVQALALLRIWTTPSLNMMFLWKFFILIASLLMLGPPAMNWFCIFMLVYHRDLRIVEQVSEISYISRTRSLLDFFEVQPSCTTLTYKHNIAIVLHYYGYIYSFFLNG